MEIDAKELLAQLGLATYNLAVAQNHIAELNQVVADLRAAITLQQLPAAKETANGVQVDALAGVNGASKEAIPA